MMYKSRFVKVVREKAIIKVKSFEAKRVPQTLPKCRRKAGSPRFIRRRELLGREEERAAFQTIMAKAAMVMLKNSIFLIAIHSQTNGTINGRVTYASAFFTSSTSHL